MILWDYVKEKMIKNPSQTIGEGQGNMTYEETVILVEEFAKKLEGEKTVCILCRSEMFAAIALLSCFAANVTAVPMSMRYGEEHCKRVLNTVDPSAIITDIYGDLEIVCLPYSSVEEDVRVNPALIMCTSGTTGTPKGVMLSSENVLTNLKDICAYFDIRNDDTLLISRPIYHCSAITGELLAGLVKGVRIIFCSGRLDATDIMRQVEKNKVTVLCATPTVFSLLARLCSRYDTSSLKTLCISGECMSASLANRIAKTFAGTRIYHVYGLTEACPRVSYLPPELFEKYLGSVGVPLSSVSIKIVKADGDEARIGEDGILWVKGKNVMLGYYNAPDLTDKVLRDGWLCTGDVAYMNADGMLYIKGRSDNMIIRAGMNVYPAEIENALSEDRRVKEIMAYGKKCEDQSEKICLKITGDFSDVAEVKELCVKSLPAYAIPTHIELVDSLPKNGSGKIIRGGNNV